MIEYQQKMRMKRKLYSKPVLVALVIIFLLLLNSTWNVYKKKVESEKNLAALQNNYDSLQVRQKELSANIDKMNTQAGIEQEIMSKFSVAKNGENVAIVVASDSNATDTPVYNPGFFEKIWNWLKDIIE
jgi:cell division protein FtsB